MALTVHRHVTGLFFENTYIAIDSASGQAVVVDPGLGSLAIWKPYEEMGMRLAAAFVTHAHVDHIAGLREIRMATGAPVYLSRHDLFLLDLYVASARTWGLTAEPAPLPDFDWNDGDRLRIGETEFEVLHTPGHSPGSVCLRWNDGIFTGDTLMRGQIGRVDPAMRGSQEQLEDSIINRLYTLPDAVPIYPGHLGGSTIGREKRFNPHVLPR